MANLTKAQLLARLAEVEAQCAAFEREREAQLIAERPSRSEPIVIVRGVPHRKVIRRFGARTETRYVVVA